MGRTTAVPSFLPDGNEPLYSVVSMDYEGRLDLHSYFAIIRCSYPFQRRSVRSLVGVRTFASIAVSMDFTGTSTLTRTNKERPPFSGVLDSPLPVMNKVAATLPLPNPCQKKAS